MASKGAKECQRGNVGKIRLPRKKDCQILHSILADLWTTLQPLFCWRYFYFESRLSVKCCSLSHFFFLHQIVRRLTQKFLSDTPDSQHCERRGIHCPGLCLSPRQPMHLIHKGEFILALLILKKSSSYSTSALGIRAFKQSREQILITWVILKSSIS